MNPCNNRINKMNRCLKKKKKKHAAAHHIHAVVGPQVTDSHGPDILNPNMGQYVLTVGQHLKDKHIASSLRLFLSIQEETQVSLDEEL